jgi:ADP-ribose pyrophosphatase YjhB (NUDIX family)
MYEKYNIVLSVAGFIFNEKGQLLIVKKSTNEQIDAGLWTVPGGKIYPHENIVDGLRREIQEEVGLEVENLQWIGEDVFPELDIMFHAEHFTCKATSSDVKLEKKLIEYKWIAGVPDLTPLPFAENIKKRIITIFTKNE